jgi:hypothetical protein
MNYSSKGIKTHSEVPRCTSLVAHLIPRHLITTPTVAGNAQTLSIVNDLWANPFTNVQESNDGVRLICEFHPEIE